MKKTPFVIMCLLVTANFTFSVKAEDSAHQSSNETHSESEVHWSYEGEGRPENWGKIKSDFKPCRLGQFQSPVDLKENIKADLPDVVVDYKDVPLTILNNGHTIQVNYPEGSTMTVDGRIFNLLQFHFHTPSEHTIEGKSFPMEMHFVHKDKDGKLGVLGVMIAEGEENAVAKNIWGHMPATQADPQEISGVHINAGGMLPTKTKYYRLSGSLTTPPCTEGVSWHVLDAPITFSKDQIEKFKSIFPLNARPVQPIGNRLLLLDR